MLKETAQKLTKCLCCGSTDLVPYLNLGDQPLANGYLVDPPEKWPAYPLGLNVCTNCWHSQLTHSVDRKALFDHYDYVSGTSKTLIQFFDWFAQQLKSSLGTPGSVLDLASNDGSFIQALSKIGLDCLGVEPAKNIAAEAIKKGAPTICGYRPEVAQEIDTKFDAIVCMNVLAHVDTPKLFLKACAKKLKPDGRVFVMPSQARMIGNCEFDTCYHEHVSFFNSRSIAILAESVGLTLEATRLLNIHGDSPLYILRKTDSKPTNDFEEHFREPTFAIPEALLAYEVQSKLFTRSTYDQFEQDARNVLRNFQETLREHRVQGYEIIYVGAAAKSITVLNACQEKPDRIIDEAPKKIGKIVPGTDIRIESLEDASYRSPKTLFVITAWNFRHELAKKLQALAIPKQSRFFAYFPKPEFFS